MKVIDVPIDKLKPYPGNPRKNEASVPYVADSIRKFGFQQPIVVDDDYIVIAGHTRLLAARHLGLKSVPVHVADHLTGAQAAAYRLADNRSGEFSDWDADQLLEELSALDPEFSADSLGFEIEDIDPEVDPVSDWDFSNVQDEYVITIRGQLDMQADVRERLRDIEGVTIEASYLKKA